MLEGRANNPAWKPIAEDAALLQGLSQPKCDLVLGRASLRRFDRGRSVFRQEEPAEKMFLLVSGRVRLQEVTPEGGDFLFRLVRPGETFGDQAAVPGQVYGATSTVDETAHVYFWKAADVLELQQRIPRLTANLLAISLSYLRTTRQRFRVLTTCCAEQRIWWALEYLAQRFGQPHTDGIEITGRTLQKDVGDLSATSVFTVNRALRGYERTNLLTRKRGRIVLHQEFRQRPATCSIASSEKHKSANFLRVNSDDESETCR